MRNGTKISQILALIAVAVIINTFSSLLQKATPVAQHNLRTNCKGHWVMKGQQSQLLMPKLIHQLVKS